jgi:hypothetical protein
MGNRAQSCCKSPSVGTATHDANVHMREAWRLAHAQRRAQAQQAAPARPAGPTTAGERNLLGTEEAGRRAARSEAAHAAARAMREAGLP